MKNEYKDHIYICKSCSITGTSHEDLPSLPNNWKYSSYKIKGRDGKEHLLPGYICEKCAMVKRIIK